MIRFREGIILQVLDGYDDATGECKREIETTFMQGETIEAVVMLNRDEVDLKLDNGQVILGIPNDSIEVI